MYDKKKVLEDINMGAKKTVGDKFYLFAKYGFTGITILVIALGIVYGGI